MVGVGDGTFNRAMVCSYRMSIATISLALIVWPQFARQFWSPTVSTLRCRPDTPYWGQREAAEVGGGTVGEGFGCLYSVNTSRMGLWNGCFSIFRVGHTFKSRLYFGLTSVQLQVE